MTHLLTARFRATSTRRRGGLLIELVICGTLLGAVTATLVPTIRHIGLQRRYTAQSEAALLEVENLMEQATAVPWSELTTERLAPLQISSQLATQLSDSHLEIRVDIDPHDSLAKIVAIELNWNAGPAQPAPVTRLCTWVYSREDRP